MSSADVQPCEVAPSIRQLEAHSDTPATEVWAAWAADVEVAGSEVTGSSVGAAVSDTLSTGSVGVDEGVSVVLSATVVTAAVSLALVTADDDDEESQSSD